MLERNSHNTFTVSIAFISTFLVPRDFTLAAAGDKVLILKSPTCGMLEDTKGNGSRSRPGILKKLTTRADPYCIRR